MIVYEDNGSVIVSAILPTVAMGMVDAPELQQMAEEVEEKLRRAVDRI